MQVKNLVRLLLTGMVLASAHAQGASFDCGKSARPIEKSICASERVSRLDGDLGEAYRTAVESSRDPAVLLSAQRAWIKERNKCQDEACLVSAYEQRIAALRPVKSPASSPATASLTPAPDVSTAPRATNEPSSPGVSAPAQRPAPTAAATETADDARDLIVFFSRDSALKVVTAIDGSKRMSNPSALLRNAYGTCIMLQHPYKLGPVDTLGLPESDLLSLSGDLIRRQIDLAAGGTVKQAYVSSDCVQANAKTIRYFPEILLIPRKLLAEVQNKRFFGPVEAKYDAFYVLRRSEIDQAAAQANTQRDQAVVAGRQSRQRVDSLAAVDSQEYVTSVNLSYPNVSSLRYCTLVHSGASAAAMLGYADGGMEWLTPAMRARVEAVSAKSKGQPPFHIGYASLDELYQRYQQNANDCHVYVDYAKNVKALMVAIERDQGGRQLELNEIVLAKDLRDSWARHTGFSDWSTSEFADSIKASADQVKALAVHGIKTRPAFMASMAEMKSAGYASSSELSVLLAYLADKKSASKGQTAVTVKQERERSERVLAEQRQSQARAREAEHAKQFPYTATLSCGMGDRHLNVLGCFTGKHVNTELEIRNGNDYKMLKAWEISQHFRESPEGLVIPLRNSFQVKAQNSNDTLTLTLKVKENATGRIVYQKSAGKFGAVSVRN